jgi:mono/diheme cytochrome c family protein
VRKYSRFAQKYRAPARRRLRLHRRRGAFSLPQRQWDATRMRLASLILGGVLAGNLTLAALAQPPDGAAIFRDQCAVCHQPQGQGLRGQFPPLAGNGDIFLSRDFPARVVLFGLSGKIEVQGETIDSAMPPLDFLSDPEIAAVVGFVRQSWGNAALPHEAMEPLDAATVAGLRAQQQALAGSVHSERARLKGVAAKH